MELGEGIDHALESIDCLRDEIADGFRADWSKDWILEKWKELDTMLHGLTDEIGDLNFSVKGDEEMAKKKEPASNGNVIEAPVSFKQVSVGAKTARIGVTFDRSDLTLAKADKTLCQHRLVGRIVAKPEGEDPDQQVLPGMEDTDLYLDGIFDVKGLSVSGDQIGVGLTFAVKDVSVSELAKFAQRSGRIIIKEVQDLPAGEDEDEHQADDE